MDVFVSDAASFFKQLRQQLIGLGATYVDVTLHAVNDAYGKLCKHIEKNFI